MFTMPVMNGNVMREAVLEKESEMPIASVRGPPAENKRRRPARKVAVGLDWTKPVEQKGFEESVRRCAREACR